MWSKILNILVGTWLMVAPAILEYGPEASNNGHIIGPIIITFSVISLWEATDLLRKWNYPFGVWLILAPWVLSYAATLPVISDMASGILIIVLSSFTKKIKYRYGGGWASLWKENPEHMGYRKKNSDEVQ